VTKGEINVCSGRFPFVSLHVFKMCLFVNTFANHRTKVGNIFGMSTLLVVYAHSLPFDVFVKISYAKAPATESKSES